LLSSPMGRFWKKFLEIWKNAREPKKTNTCQSVALIGHLAFEHAYYLRGWSIVRSIHAKNRSHIRKNPPEPGRVIAQPINPSYKLTPLRKPNKNKDNIYIYVFIMILHTQCLSSRFWGLLGCLSLFSAQNSL
jgi:hypothetical protein